MRKRIGFAMLMTCLIILGMGDMGDCASRKLLSFGSSQTASAFYPIYVTMAKVINKTLPDVNVTVIETGGGEDNLSRILKGQVDFSQVTTDIAYMAYNGLYGYAGKPSKKIRYFLCAVGAQQNFMVRKDSKITRIEELEGKKFHPGMRGSASEMNSQLVLASLGIKPIYYRGGSADAIEAFKNGDIVGQVKSGLDFRLDPASMEVHLFVPLRFLSFDEAHRKKASEKLPYLPWVQVPDGIVKDQPSFWTYETLTSFLTSTDVPEDLIYRITKALWQGRAEVQEVWPAIKNVDLIKETIAKATVPLHTGAVRYFRELGYKVPDRLIPPEMK